MEKIHANSSVPKKNTKNRRLTKEERKRNREIAIERMPIEHINRDLKYSG
ncbi:hypothetical protein [Parasediminibacterium sp. JCM 36343]